MTRVTDVAAGAALVLVLGVLAVRGALAGGWWWAAAVPAVLGVAVGVRTAARGVRDRQPRWYRRRPS